MKLDLESTKIQQNHNEKLLTVLLLNMLAEKQIYLNLFAIISSCNFTINHISKNVNCLQISQGNKASLKMNNELIDDETIHHIDLVLNEISDRFNFLKVEFSVRKKDNREGTKHSSVYLLI